MADKIEKKTSRRQLQTVSYVSTIKIFQINLYSFNAWHYFQKVTPEEIKVIQENRIKRFYCKSFTAGTCGTLALVAVKRGII